jgi:AcrR family transcriptional regulator
MNKSRGRPRGNPPTRNHLVEVARALFLERGYQGTTVRAIAAGAGVDSALISYHFGSKHGLFAEAMLLRLSPSALLGDALGGDPAGLPERLLHAVTELWDDPEHSAPLAALIRTALQDEAVLRAFREYTEREVHGRIAEYLSRYTGPREATERAAAASAVIGGLIFTRYLVPLPTAAGLSADGVRRVFGPALRAALAGGPPRHHNSRTSTAATGAR